MRIRSRLIDFYMSTFLNKRSSVVYWLIVLSFALALWCIPCPYNNLCMHVMIIVYAI